MESKNKKLILTKQDLSMLVEYFEENDIPKEVIEEMIEISFLVTEDEKDS